MNIWNILKLEPHLYNYWKTKNSANYIEYLRSKGIKIGENVVFRYPRHTTIDVSRPWLIEIGNNIGINDYFSIMTHDFMTRTFRALYNDFVPSSGRVRIGDNVTIGRNVLLLKGAIIGDNCCIGAGSIVTKPIPSNSLAVGAPCKRICSVEEYYERRKIACVEEAIDNGVAYYERYGKFPPIEAFYEEWTLFLNEDDLKRYPQMQQHVDKRISMCRKEFYGQQHLIFNGYDEFLNAIRKRIKDKKGLIIK